MAVERPRRYAPRLPPAERREQVLDVALALVAADGWSAVSMEAIARAAGVTRPVVYSAFPNLKLLLGALLLRERSRALAQLDAIVPIDPGARDADDLVVEGLRAFLTTVAGHPDTWRLILTPVQGTPSIVRREVERNRARILDRIRPLVRWGLQTRGPRELDAEMVARSILVLAEEAGRLVLTAPADFPPERVASFARDALRAVGRDG